MERIPDELVLHIFSWLPLFQQTRLCEASQRLRALYPQAATGLTEPPALDDGCRCYMLYRHQIHGLIAACAAGRILPRGFYLHCFPRGPDSTHADAILDEHVAQVVGACGSSLHQLWICSNDMTDSVLDAVVAGCPRLVTLSLVCERVGTLEALAGSKSLRNVRLEEFADYHCDDPTSRRRISDESLTAFASLQLPLSRLCLKECQNLTDRSLEAIAECRTLTALDIDAGNGAGDFHEEALAALGQLRLREFTILCDETLGDDAFIPIAQGTGDALERLSLSQVCEGAEGREIAISDLTLFAFARCCPNLRELYLGVETGLTPQVVSAIAQLSRLEDLQLGDFHLRDQASTQAVIECVENLHQLRAFSIQGECDSEVAWSALLSRQLDPKRRMRYVWFPRRLPSISASAGTWDAYVNIQQGFMVSYSKFAFEDPWTVECGV